MRADALSLIMHLKRSDGVLVLIEVTGSLSLFLVTWTARIEEESRVLHRSSKRGDCGEAHGLFLIHPISVALLTCHGLHLGRIAVDVQTTCTFESPSGCTVTGLDQGFWIRTARPLSDDIGSEMTRIFSEKKMHSSNSRRFED